MKSPICEGCSDCLIQRKTLSNAVLEAAVVIEHFNAVMAAVKEYEVAVEKWKLKHEKARENLEVGNDV